MKKNNQFYFRKAHRWLGVIIGIQFLLWTISGLYFSWTDIADIHGDHFLKESNEKVSLTGLSIPDTINVKSIDLRIINDKAFVWLNEELLFNPIDGSVKTGISENEALGIVKRNVQDEYQVKSCELITSVNNHHEYRGGPLPAWEITFEGNEKISAYVSQADGSFQKIRHRSWRWFDFLWMTHTMDYQGRDDFNNILLRIFSFFGLLTVLSGFTLFLMTSRRKRRKTKKSRV